MYCRLTAPEVRRQLISHKGYTDDQLPSLQTITCKLNDLGYRLGKVRKCLPKKKIPQTNAIFAELKQVHADAAASRNTLRLSLDAKATVKIGPFSRGGYSRTGNAGADHDFEPTGQLTPFGIFVPEYDELDLYFTHSKVSSDFMADVLGEWVAAEQGAVWGGARVTAGFGQRTGEPQPPHPVLVPDGEVCPEEPGDGPIGILPHPTTASTTRSRDTGGFWRGTGVEKFWIVRRRCWVTPGP